MRKRFATKLVGNRIISGIDLWIATIIITVERSVDITVIIQS